MTGVPPAGVASCSVMSTSSGDGSGSVVSRSSHTARSMAIAPSGHFWTQSPQRVHTS